MKAVHDRQNNGSDKDANIYHLQCNVVHSIDERIATHSHIQVCITKPLYRLLHCCYCAK